MKIDWSEASTKRGIIWLITAAGLSVDELKSLLGI